MPVNAIPVVSSGFDPRDGSGVAAEVGTAAKDRDGRIFLKTGTGNTDWTLLEGWQYVKLGAPATTVSFSGLDGDKDVAYDIIGVFPFNSGATDVVLRPNGVSSNQRGVVITSANGGAATPGALNSLFLTSTTTAGQSSFFRATLQARRGAGARLATTQSGFGTGAGAISAQTGTSIWQEDSTNILSLDIVATVASAIGSGGFFAIKPVGLVR